MAYPTAEFFLGDAVTDGYKEGVVIDKYYDGNEGCYVYQINFKDKEVFWMTSEEIELV